MPRPVKELAALDIGDNSGPTRTLMREQRSARRKSPYGSPKKGPPSLSSAVDALGLNSAKGQRRRVAFPLPVDPETAFPGCGGARGPIERLKEQQAWVKTKNDEAQRRLVEKESRRRRETSLVARHIKNRSVDEWRDNAIDDFLNAKSVPVSRVNSPPEPPPRPKSSGGPKKMMQLPPLPRECAQARKRRATRVRSQSEW